MIARKYWASENNLHWQLNVTFNEDKQQKRAGNAEQNSSTTNKITFSLLKNEKLQIKVLLAKYLAQL